MKYIQTVILLILTTTGLSVAHAHVIMFAPVFGYVFNAAFLGIAFEIGLVLILLHKKSLNIISLALLLLFTNIVSLFLFVFTLLFFILEKSPPYIITIVFEILIIIFEAFVLASATRLTIFRKLKGPSLTFKATLTPLAIGNIASVVLGICFLEFYEPPQLLTSVENSVIGQGTWGNMLEARDFDGNTATIEGYYDTVMDITWLADANKSGVARTWDSANAWIGSLDVNGITGWRFPMEKPSKVKWKGVMGPPVFELSNLYFVTLGNASKYPGDGLTNTGPFSNVQTNRYWSGIETDKPGGPSEYHPFTTAIITFDFSFGGRPLLEKNIDRAFVWPVHDGDVGTHVSK